jgi:GT2 family glycosyltransferase
VLRHAENLGTSGAVHAGFRYALDHEYDWIWVFDADSHPDPDALEKLLQLYGSWLSDAQEKTAFIACLAHGSRDHKPVHGQIFTRRGINVVTPSPGAREYRCHATIWSGCLYRLAAVRRIGLPNPDYVLDCGEGEYGWRVMRAGYDGFIDQAAVCRHNVRGKSSFSPVQIRLGPLTLTFFEVPPIRCYYGFRNTLYLALYEIAYGGAWLILRSGVGLTFLLLNFLVRPLRHRRQIAACFRGIWHGVTGNLAARY